MPSKKIQNTASEFLIFTNKACKDGIEVRIQDETVWLTQKLMAALFDCSTDNISLHLKNIFANSELDEVSVTEDFSVTATDGKNYKTKHYNLDAIISVGYRVNSAKATQFRIWQQITDIFAECSIDYNKNSKITNDFYAMVQNKFHFAITGQTAAEIIYSKADRYKENMGLTTWKNSPDGRILKSDITTAKNYLSETEIKRLERAVTSYFDYIEDLIEQQNTFTMEEFAASINKFLAFRKIKILSDKGKITKQKADEKAEAEYDEFNKTQNIVSDFDIEVKKMIEKLS